MLLLVMPGMVLAEARGRAAVIDGDTLDVSGTEVRLSGIDAPELDQRCSTSGDVLNENSDTYPCGMEAAAVLADRIGDDPVICDEPASGSQKPVVAVCWLNDEDLGAWLVRSGGRGLTRTLSHPTLWWRRKRRPRSEAFGVATSSTPGTGASSRPEEPGPIVQS